MTSSSRDNSLFPFAGTQSFTYDADGNVLTDGQWQYTWDAENRLIAMQTDPARIPPIASTDARRLEFKYDYLGRRVEKLVRAGWNGTLYTTVVWQNRYLYDGWSLIAEYSVAGSALTLVRSYTWGLDIARSLTDAGGVGALLQIVDHASGKSYQPAYDGNGNVAALINGSTGAIAAVYEYSPFGELVRADTPDSTVAGQPFRFSTKFTDDETGLVYYGHRYYSPSQGRFLGRDPKEEAGGLNLYGFCGNNAVNLFDVLGNWVYQEYDSERGWYYVNDADLAQPSDVSYDTPSAFDLGLGGSSVDWGGTSNIWSTGDIHLAWVISNAGSKGGGPLFAPSPLLNDLKPLKSPDQATHLIIDPNTSSDMAALLSKEIDQLRDLKNADGTLTQAALILRALEQSGKANGITILGTYHRDTSRAPSDTQSLDEKGASNGAGSLSLITMQVNAVDSVAALAHELVHAAQDRLGISQPFTRIDESEPVAVENQVLVALHLDSEVSQTHSGSEIDGWNKYVPWITTPPNKQGSGSG